MLAQNPTLEGHPGDYGRADIEYGARLYAQHCANCHGTTGDGVANVDLRSGKFRTARTDLQLRAVITNGFPNTGMPSFRSLDAAELTGLVAYIRNMNTFDTGSMKAGDAARGHAIFEGKGACLSCHRVNNKGSRKAPDLSDIGLVRSAGSLQRSPRDPSSQMFPINRPVRAVTRDGKVINGRRLNEDTYTVQLTDEEGRLHSLHQIRSARIHHFDEVDHALLREGIDAGGNRRRRAVPAFTERPMTMRRHRILIAASLVLAASASLRLGAQAPVTYERLLNAAKEPHNYLTYGGDYFSTRYSTLSQITPANVKNLNLAWVYQASVTGSWQPTPLVVDGIMYLTQRPNYVVALDATTGRVFWIDRHSNEDVIACCGSNNRGVAILGELLYMGTLDGHLVAIDAKSGRQVWKTKSQTTRRGTRSPSRRSR